MKQPKRLSCRELERLFNIKLPRRPTRKQRERCEAINALFDEVIAKHGIRERAIFEGAYPNDRELAHTKLFAFLKNVRSCPKRVIEYAQQMLNTSDEK